MAGAVGAANIRLGAIVSGFIDGMRAASKEVKTLTYETNTNLTKAFKQADTQAKIFKGGITRLGNEVSSLGKKMTTFGTLPILFGGAAAFKEFAGLEKLQIGLQQYGESLKSVKELAKLPNVSVEGAAESLIQLRAVGVESDLAKRNIVAFANALTAAGKSSTDLAPALANITQMLSTNTVSAADVKELANRIPQARKALIDAFGTASGEELTKIGAEKVVRGLIEQLEKIPKVGSGAGTAMEQFQDSVKFATAQMGEGINRAFNLTENIKKLGDLIETATEKFTSLSPNVQDNIIKFTGLVAIIGPAIFGIGQLIKLAPALGTAFSLAGGPISIVISALALFIVYYKDIIRMLEGAAIKFTGINNAMKSNPMTSPFAAADGGVLETTASGILSQTAKWRREERQQARRDLRAQNEQTKQLASAQAEAQKSAAEQAKNLSNALKGVDKAQSDALGSGQAYKDLIQKNKEEEAERLRILKETKDIGSGMKELVPSGASMYKVDPRTGNLGEFFANRKFNADLAAKNAGKTFSGVAGSMDDTVEGIKDANDEYKREMARMQEITKQTNEDINYSIRAAGTEVGASFGEMIGNLANGENAFQSFGKRVLTIIGSLLKDIGKSLIALGTAGKAFEFFKTKPGLAIAAGVALTAAGQVVSNAAQKKVDSARFAKGGFAYGEMSAIVGDNPNARFDPEMIAPYSKVDQSIKKSIAESGRFGEGGFVASTSISARELLILIEREKQSQKGLLGI